MLASDDVAVVEVEYRRERALHERYGSTPCRCVVIADADGVVRASFLGPVTATDLLRGRSPAARARRERPNGADASGAGGGSGHDLRRRRGRLVPAQAPASARGVSTVPSPSDSGST